MPGRTGNARVLALDPELGLRIPADEISRARQQLVAPVLQLPVGHWDVPHGDGSTAGSASWSSRASSRVT